MRARTSLAVAVVAVIGAGSLSPALAGPKPTVMKYKATATPDPTTTVPGGAKCDPKTPTAKHKKEFKVPGAGTLTMALDNKLDWAAAVRADGETLGDADGADVQDKETVTVKFKKAQTVSLEACNWSAEPEVDITVTFVPKK